MDVRFRDRKEAGKTLGAMLGMYSDTPGLLILALPRGGVPVAFEIATALGAAMDIFSVRKLGAPGHEELAMGALTTGGVRVLNEDIIHGYGIPGSIIDAVTARETQELERRERMYRGDSPPEDVQDRTVILVDDGLATGSTMRVAVRALRPRGPGRIVVAVPVAAQAVCEILSAEVDEVVCAETPDPFFAVGLHYDDFTQTTDDEVRAILNLVQGITAGGSGERDE